MRQFNLRSLQKDTDWDINHHSVEITAIWLADSHAIKSLIFMSLQQNKFQGPAELQSDTVLIALYLLLPWSIKEDNVSPKYDNSLASFIATLDYEI